MLDKNKCKWLINDKIEYDKKFFEYPMIEENYWIPLAEELSKSVDETIAFWKELNAEEFLYTLDVLDEIIQNTKSQKILDAVKQIGEKKNCDAKDIQNRIESAECWLSDD